MTEPDNTRRNPTTSLTDRQRVAIATLLAAGTQTDAAHAAGVTRQTINDWVNHHIGFITELNKRRHEQSQTSARRLQQTVSAAIDTISAQITQGDITAAFQLLKLVGVSHLIPLMASGPRTPLSVENQLASDAYNEMITCTTQPEVAQFLVQDLSDAVSDSNDPRRE
jgi:DNA-binding XRE family transcriptional regulator